MNCTIRDAHIPHEDCQGTAPEFPSEKISHTHTHEGQTLRHRHYGGGSEHGYFEHIGDVPWERDVAGRPVRPARCSYCEKPASPAVPWGTDLICLGCMDRQVDLLALALAYGSEVLPV